MRSLTNGAGVVLQYAYDVLGRATNQAIDGVASSVAFDELGRPRSVNNSLGSFVNAYDANTFRLRSVEYPNGQTNVFSYTNAANDFRLSEIKNLGRGAATISQFNYTYDPDGQIKTWTQKAGAANPSVWTLDYDPVDQLLGATISVMGVVARAHFYGYDPAGNRLAEQIDTAVTGGRFNGLNQLANTINGGRVRIAGHLTNKPGTVVVGTNAAVMDREHTSFVAYAEVANGSNVIPIAATDFQGHSATNRYQITVANNSVAKTLTYDLNGNLTTVATAGSTQTYAWDAADRLVSITQSGDGTNLASSRFEYDGTGRRVRIVEMTNNTTLSDKRFVWAGSELAEERTSSGAVTRRFFGQGEQIGGTNYYFTRDHLGSVREMTDATATVRARYEYDPYGRRTRVEGSIDADFGFTGHYVHAPSGLHLALYRAYDAETGRWLSRDPIGESGGINLYAYVANSPIVSEDRLGLAISPEEMNSATVNYILSQRNYAAVQSQLQLLLDQAHNLAKGCGNPRELSDLTGYANAMALRPRIAALLAEVRLARANAILAGYDWVNAWRNYSAAGPGLVASAYAAAQQLPVGAILTGTTGAALASGGAIVGVAAAGGWLGYKASEMPWWGGGTVASALGDAIYNVAPSLWNASVK